jgi:hypothetical protein
MKPHVSYRLYNDFTSHFRQVFDQCFNLILGYKPKKNDMMSHKQNYEDFLHI